MVSRQDVAGMKSPGPRVERPASITHTSPLAGFRGIGRLFGALLVLVLSAWIPVALGFGEPFAAAVMLVNVALAARPRII